MIFTQILSALAVVASVSALDMKSKHCAPKCKGINCLETLARINYQPSWCGAELMEKIARRDVLRPDVDWVYDPNDTTATNPCTYISTQDPSVNVALINSNSQILCSSSGMNQFYPAPTGTAPNLDITYTYDYASHRALADNDITYVNYDNYTFVAVPLYFKSGAVSAVVFAKPNSELPVVCCENPDPSLTQCRRFF